MGTSLSLEHKKEAAYLKMLRDKLNKLDMNINPDFKVISGRPLLLVNRIGIKYIIRYDFNRGFEVCEDNKLKTKPTYFTSEEDACHHINAMISIV